MSGPHPDDLPDQGRLEWLRASVRPLTGAPGDHDALLERVGNARIVMLGEASHGTAEFYEARSAITRRLLVEKGFTLLAIEGDWPEACALDAFVRGGAGTAIEALAGFRRFPTWMWRNAPVAEFAAWLRGHNDGLRPDQRVGVYGLDVYSQGAAIEAVLRYWHGIDPVAAIGAARRYGGVQPGANRRHAGAAGGARANVQALQAARGRYEAASGVEAYFQAEMNARVVVSAEAYDREMRHDGHAGWNLRDAHMVDVLERLIERGGSGSKAVVWGHNSHIGDSRATDESVDGELSVGQLLRERWGKACVAVGFGTHHGTVTAATGWERLPCTMSVPAAHEGSYEAIFHHVGVPSFYLDLAPAEPPDPAAAWLHDIHDERAIGVVYDPARDRRGNFVPSRLAERYDAYVFFDETHALEPLAPTGDPPVRSASRNDRR